MGEQVLEKSKALLQFLKDAATLRRKRVAAYATNDKILWFHNVPRDYPEIRSAFFADNPEECPDFWLEVRKKRMPARPAVPAVCKDWVRPQELELVSQEPELLPEITVLVERKVSDPDAAARERRTLIEKVPEVRRLEDHPAVQDAWLDYLVNQWEPWVQEMRRWQEVQRVYEDVDFMRRRLEEAEERFELILGLGFLVWRDPTGTTVRRHLLTAPAEISLDAARGVLTVSPAASFDGFRIELDMLEFQHQPRLEGAVVDDRLEELDVQAWERTKVGEILRVIANKASPDAQVDEDSLEPPERADDTLRVLYAPALVLRERRPTAYGELVGRLLKNTEDRPVPLTTQPWERLISEGEPSGRRASTTPYNLEANSVLGDSRLYFPLTTNEEQRKIAERLRVRPCVLVKGPPGTGKSHTIANLICHLLASGERVLVTAHAPKALAVLMSLLPEDIRNLCVTAFGSTREDQRLLENSVRGILSRKNEWRGSQWAQEQMAVLENRLSQLESEVARVERRLRETREAESYSHTLFGGYSGTAAQIARTVEEKRMAYEWFPELPNEEVRCPLDRAEIKLLAEIHSELTEELLTEISFDIGDISLPNPEEFKHAIAELNSAEQSADAANMEIHGNGFDAFRHASEEALQVAEAFLKELEVYAARASRILGDSTFDILGDLLLGFQERWSCLSRESAKLVRSLRDACERLGNVSVEISAGDPRQILFADVRKRLDYLQKHKWPGIGFLAPRVMRETRHVEKSCRIDGQAPRQPQQLEALIAFLELEKGVAEFRQIWPSVTLVARSDPRHAVADVERLSQELQSLVALFQNPALGALDLIPASKRAELARSKDRENWLALVRAEMARRQLDQARDRIERWRALLAQIVNPHHSLERMIEAIDERDVQKWRTSWETRERLKRHKDRLLRYGEFVRRLEAVCPGLQHALTSTQGSPEWGDRLLNLEDAWAWSAAKAWLRKVTDPEVYERLAQERHRLQNRIEKKLEELAALKAWHAFFVRLDDLTEQNLTAWTRAMQSIGKGTGRYAYRHRRTARRYLMECIPRIPAWIMPLHKLWETTDSSPGVFDTVIVDEASQAGIDALALLLLAKRIIVVGDDKQNSPEAVGIPEDDIARLARDHLRDFRFRDEFRPDTSLYDHAQRAFGNAISLREHFRCVPEIIRFSNDLCYTDAPLIPLRQPPPKRISPLKATFVEEGICEGEGQRIFNRAEAEKIVDTIRLCLDDKDYEGKTMGVIVLQGYAQAQHIEKKLAELLEPRVREERKLRCGVPATFQGDQRDVIFLSLVVAPNYNFRALTGLPDQRRFNVAMSRARDQVWLFHSVRLHDLNREDLRWRLLSFFSSPGQPALDAFSQELERLEREAGRRPRQPGEQPEPYESWFEVDVALELLKRKYRLLPQVEVAGYRIDLVVEGLENRLAVECDGDAWHGPERFEQDMARQRQLERVGWTFVRIRESEFYADRAGAVRRIVDACEELGIRPIEEREQEIDELQTVGAPVDEALSLEQETEEDESEPEDNESEESCFPDPRDASPANVRAALRRIIEEEGPLTKRLLFKLYLAGCPTLRRAGRNVRSILNRVLYGMQRAGEIIVEDELGDRSLESQVVRLAIAPRVRERSTEGRDLLEIPPSELFLVLNRLLGPSKVSRLSDEEVFYRLLEHYGFSRLTAVRRRHLAKMLECYRRLCRSFEFGIGVPTEVSPIAHRTSSESGDRAFLRSLPPELKDFGAELLQRVRSLFPGDLVFHPTSGKYVESPDNFWTIRPQPRAHSFRITVRGEPELFSSIGGSLRVQRDWGSYSCFTVERPSQIEDLIRVLKQVRRK
jgi:very-short-patch-repair endonuclease